MREPTELQLQAAAMGTVANLIRAAVLAGVPQTNAPTWVVLAEFVEGNLRSADASALLALDAWRIVIGKHRASTYVLDAAEGPRRIYTVTATIADVAIRLCASIPAHLAPRNTPLPAPAAEQTRELVTA